MFKQRHIADNYYRFRWDSWCYSTSAPIQIKRFCYYSKQYFL